ncbi:MAG: Holliday junction branch migration DNA helicase RuvB, partial [Deltaproteobacteria bacterium]|nr:Holliday junction branch migration DNA helicase RuvB [Deltaproteobacteria bacterium]
ETLATAVNGEKETLEDVYEPYLIQEGLLDRTSRGRKITLLALEHLGKKIRDLSQERLI